MLLIPSVANILIGAFHKTFSKLLSFGITKANSGGHMQCKNYSR